MASIPLSTKTLVVANQIIAPTQQAYSSVYGLTTQTGVTTGTVANSFWTFLGSTTGSASTGTITYSGGYFTVHAAGLYLICSGFIYQNTNSTFNSTVTIRKNAATTPVDLTTWALSETVSGGVFTGVQLCTVNQLNSGDTIALVCTFSSNTFNFVGGNVSGPTNFTVLKLF